MIVPVALADNAFSPAALTVKVGTTVKWNWADDEPHNVTVTAGPVTFRSSTKESGSYKHKFARKGTYKLLCTVHAPDMKMTVRVKKQK